MQLLLYLLAGCPILGLLFWRILKPDPVSQDPSDILKLPPWVEKFGLPAVLLGLLIAFVWALLKWMRPYADRLANEVVARPGFLEAQAARDAANAARDQIQAELIKQLCERVSTQSELTREMVGQVKTLIELQRKSA